MKKVIKNTIATALVLAMGAISNPFSSFANETTDDTILMDQSRNFVYFEIHQGIEIISIDDLDVSQRSQDLNNLSDRSSDWTDISTGTQRGRWRGGMSNREGVFSDAYSNTGMAKATVSVGMNAPVTGGWRHTWEISSARAQLGAGGHRSFWDLMA